MTILSTYFLNEFFRELLKFNKYGLSLKYFDHKIIPPKLFYFVVRKKKKQQQ